MTTEVKEILPAELIAQNGGATLEFVEAFQRVVDAIRELQSFQTTVAGITKPTGGATIDAEARTAIDAIVDSA